MIKRTLLTLLLTLAVVSSAKAGTIGYWTFEENDGQYAYCAPIASSAATLRLGSSGTAYQDPVWTAEGYSGSCLHFHNIVDGPDGAIDILRPESDTDVSQFSTESFTIEAWIKLDSIPISDYDYYNPYTILSFGGTDGADLNKHAYFLRINRRDNGTGLLNGYYYAADESSKSVIHSAELQVGQWYHVAFAHDASISTDNISIWVNGVEEVSSSALQPRTDLTLTGESLCVGAMWTRQRCFDGIIDEVRVSNTRLTTNELLINADTQRRTLAYWRFEEQVGQIAHCEPGLSGLNLRRGTSDSDWHDCDWLGQGQIGGGVFTYSDIDNAKLGYLTTDAASEVIVPSIMTDSFTIEAWINPEYIPLLNAAGTGAEFGFYDPFSIFDIREWSSSATITGDNSLFCLLRFMPNSTGEEGRFEAIWYDPNTVRTILHNSTDIPEKQWTHIAFAFDGTKAVDNATLFVNGVGTTWSTGRAPRRDQILPKVTVGGRYTGSYVNRGFWGKIDEVRITNKALTAEELLLPANYHEYNPNYLDADLNKDFYVDVDDLAVLAQNWLAQ